MRTYVGGSARLLCALMLAGAIVAAPGQAQAPAAATEADPFASIPAPRPADVASPHAVVLALYDVISGDAGVKRDWNRFRSLFHPAARLIPTGKNPDTGIIGARILTPQDYIDRSGPRLEGEGFHEVELAYQEQRFGNIAHIFTTYAARAKLSDAEPFMRGINSVQLFDDGKRWWIMNVTWSQESHEHPLPVEYLPPSK